MASVFTDKYANFDLATGANDGTSEANAWRTVGAVNAGATSGIRINIKRQAAAFNLTGSLSFNVTGIPNAPVWYRAYDQTIGDGGFWEVKYNTASVANLSFSGAYSLVEGVDFKRGANSNSHAFNVAGVESTLIRSKIVMEGPVATCSLYGCRDSWIQVSGNPGSAITILGTNVGNVSIQNSVFYGQVASTGGIVHSDMFSRAVVFQNCCFIGSNQGSGVGLYSARSANTRGLIVNNCRFYRVRHGIYIDQETASLGGFSYINNCLFSTIGTYAIDRHSSLGPAFLSRINECFYHNCGSGFSDYIDPADEAAYGIRELTVSPFLDASGLNLEMNSATSGGLEVRRTEQFSDPTGSRLMKNQPFGQWWRAPTATTPISISIG